MDSPLKDLIDKVADAVDGKSKEEEPKKTTKKATSGVTKAKAKRALDMMDSKSKNKQVLEEKKKVSDLEKQKEALSKKTHQDMINAAYKVAEDLKLKGGPWPLLRAAGWGTFTDDRGALYKGPAIDEIEALTDEQKKALKKALDV